MYKSFPVLVTVVAASALNLAAPTPASAANRISMAFLGDWSETARYRKGDVVLYNEALYQSLKAKNQSAQPDIATTYWRKILGTGTGLDAGPVCSKPKLDANLIGCDYSADTIVKDKDLRGAKLIDAKLAGDLGAMNLDGADLTGAFLGVSNNVDPPTGTALVLKGGIGSYYIASFRGAKLVNTATPLDFPLQASGIDFSGANLNNIYWPGANLETSTLTHASMVHAQLWNCICTMANFAYADLRWAVLWDAKSDTAILYGANLSHASLTGADLSGADLTGADLTGALLGIGQAATKLAGATLTGADLTRADFTGAEGGDSVIYDATTHFEATICPDGNKTDGVAIPTCQAHGFGAPQE